MIITPLFLSGQELKTKKKKGQYYFYLSNQNLNDKGYDEVEKISYYDYYLVKSDKYGLVNNLGFEIISCIYDTIIFESKTNFIVKQNDKYGVINNRNEILVEIKYQDIDHYTEDSVALVKLDGKWGILENDSINYDQEKIIFHSPEEMPQFTYCVKGSDSYDFETKCYEELMMLYIFNEIRYPKEARNNNISGLVVVSFIVTEIGEIVNPIIKKEIGGGCGEESVRMVKTMKNWLPGKQDGNNVKTIYNLPVVFKLK